MSPPAPQADDDGTGTELDGAFDRTLDEGTQRLERTWLELLVTGYIGGTEIALGVLAYLAVRDATGSVLLGGLAFSIGLLALLLGHSELFTEDFLVPVTTVVAKRATWGQLAKLWIGTLVMNLVGGWSVMWVVTVAFPGLHDRTIESAAHFVESPLSLQTFALAMLAGLAITVMTRMQNGTDSMPARMVASVVAGFLLVGLELFHSVVDSLLVFGALHTGRAPFGYLDWLGWFSWTVAGNAIGGLLLVTVVRLARSTGRLHAERVDSEEEQRP